MTPKPHKIASSFAALISCNDNLPVDYRLWTYSVSAHAPHARKQELLHNFCFYTIIMKNHEDFRIKPRPDDGAQSGKGE
jgi:hypothetical protein